MEISFATLPSGLRQFVMQGVPLPGTKFSELYFAAIHFMACASLLVVLIVIFSGIETWLPSLRS